MHIDPVKAFAPPRAEAVAARHEVEDMGTGSIKLFALGMALMLIVTFIIVALVMRVLLHVSLSSDAVPSPFAGANHPIMPEPQLQPSRNHNTLDVMDLKGLRDEEKKKLNEYAWIGPDKKAARIPVDRAMEIVLSQGLPTREGSPTGGPAALPVSGGAGGLMVAPANPLTLPPGNVRQGNAPENNERNGYGQE